MAKYDEEFKLAIVKAYLIGEGGYRSLAREWGLPDPKPLKKLGSHKLYLIDVVDG
ncbi:transposase [Alteribacillus bidgolensis]|uniref:Transposase n=1 Tax=Alteribacillus bidgolensis TaxID=930129 RepID=A0A1G8R3E4_9BACI|nr:transposase [Alteribacillus bidgolensis]SDJ11492.1 transposase [Alteribacillus bidgolensis]